MDRRMRQSLDDHIMGTNIHMTENVEHTCPVCQTKWHAYMDFDMGGWFYQDDDKAYCPACGTEGTTEKEG